MESYGENGFHRFFDFEKVSHGKFIINEIYEAPLPIVNNRSFGNARGVHKIKKVTRENPHFAIQEDEVALNAGVYKIENEDSVYIGSTINRLVDRFKNHYKNAYGTHTKTYEMIQNNGTFTCLESFPIGTDEKIIRDAEAYYILKYKNGNKELKNDMLPEVMTKIIDVNYKELQIPNEIFDDVVKILEENGYLIMHNSVYNGVLNNNECS